MKKDYREEIEPPKEKARSPLSTFLLFVLVILQLTTVAGMTYGYTLTERGANSVIGKYIIGLTESSESRSNKALSRVMEILEEAQAKSIETAKRESRVVNGMTRGDVIQVWGYPSEKWSGDKLGDSYRSTGIFEIWIYNNKPKWIYFNMGGRTIGGEAG